MVYSDNYFEKTPWDILGICKVSHWCELTCGQQMVWGILGICKVFQLCGLGYDRLGGYFEKMLADIPYIRRVFQPHAFGCDLLDEHISGMLLDIVYTRKFLLVCESQNGVSSPPLYKRTLESAGT